jgi:conjugal transfer/type IV secretion protein DotA/TraY
MIDLLSEPLATNLAWQWVSAVLPPDGSSPWGRTLQIFTSVLAFIACLGLVYSVIAGIVSTAYTGKVAGGRYHQIWSPLRVVVGIGLLMPLPNTGFSAVHYILRDIVARGGINLADAAWATFVTVVAKDGVTIAPSSQTGSTLALALLRHEVCVAVYNQAGGRWGWEQPLPNPEGIIDDGRVFWSYGSTCGRLTYTFAEDKGGFYSARRAGVAKLIEAVRPEAAKYAKLAAETSGISSADAATNAIATKVLSPTVIQDIRALGTSFDKAMEEAARRKVAAMDTTSRSKLVENAQQQGFLSAGMYWRALAQISELSSSLTTEQPDITLARTDGDFGQAIDKAFTALALQTSGETERVNLTADDFASAGDETADFLTRLIGPVARSMAEWTSSSGDEANAMSGLISSGHAMISAGWAVIAAGAGAAALAGNAISRFFGAAGVDWLLDWSKYVVGALMIVGSIRAYIIPIMPFVFMFMAGMATLAAIMEAMIALPLWAMKWLKLDNGDFIGESVRMGLLLTVNIALRPILGVLALCAAYPLFDVTLGTLDRLFATAFLGQTGGHVVGLVGMLVMTAMHLYLVWYACMKGFGQIWSLPDRVLAWTGQPGTGGEANLTSGAFGGMLALAGRGNFPKVSLTAASHRGKITAK